MDFHLTSTQHKLQEAARCYAQEHLLDVAVRVERDNAPLDRAQVRRLGELGFLGINLAPRYGGRGLGNVEALLVIEEFAKISSAVAFPAFKSCFGPVRALEEFACESIKERALPSVCRGEKVIAVSMSEAEAGSAVTDLSTTARPHGDSIILNGAKKWCAGGGDADAYFIYCRVSDAPGAKGIGAVLVERDTPGLTFGIPEDLMGFRGIPVTDIYLDNVQVPKENLIVAAGGFRKLMQTFDLERCGNAVIALAQASAGLEEATSYVQQRRQFGRPLVEFQAVQLRLAEMRMKTEAARLLIYQAASNAANALPDALSAAIAKCFSNETAREVAGAALELMGANGYSKKYSVERRLRDAWGWSIGGGALDIQKINIASYVVGRRFEQRRSSEEK